MHYRQILNKMEFETFKAKQDVLVEAGDCGMSARRMDDASRQEALDGLVDSEIEGLIKARDRVDSAPNVIVRFFAHRRYEQLRNHAVGLFGEDEVANFLTTKEIDRFLTEEGSSGK